MYQHINGTLERLELAPNPEEGCCSNRGVGDMQCILTAYVDDLLVTCKDEATITGGIEALKALYHNAQEHTGVKPSYPDIGLLLDGREGQH